MVMSMFSTFLQEMQYVHTSRSCADTAVRQMQAQVVHQGSGAERACASDCKSIRSISSRSVSAPGKSFLLPST